MKIYNFLFYLIVIPVFISLTGQLTPVLDRVAMDFDERIFFFSFSVGFISFIYFSLISLIRGNFEALLIILISVIIGFFGYLQSQKPQYVLTLQFWVLMSIFPSILKKYSYVDLRHLAINVCYIIFLFQSLSIINGLSGNYAAIIPDFAYIYNYDQYFSFAVLVGLYFSVHFRANKVFIIIYYFVAFLGAFDSENISAMYFIVIFPLILMIRFVFANFYIARDIKFLISLVSVFIIVSIPFFINFFSSSFFDQDSLGGRGSSYFQHLKEFDLTSLFIPKIFYANIPHDPHNTYLTLGVSLGYLIALIPMYTIVLHLKSLKFSHLAFVAPFVTITFSLTEPLQHQYTANLFALMFCVLLRASEFESIYHVTNRFKSINNGQINA
jgi:hypothetical protein